MKVAIIGVGLIGGSIGLAARRRAGAQVCGYDPDEHVAEKALKLLKFPTRIGEPADNFLSLALKGLTLNRSALVVANVEHPLNCLVHLPFE